MVAQSPARSAHRVAVIRFVRRRFLAIFTAAAACVLAAGCGSGPEGPPPAVPREEAMTRLRRIATRWTESLIEESRIENDPNGIASFSVRIERTLELGPGTEAREIVLRDETFRTVTGGAFHCSAQGIVPVVARAAWDRGLIRLTVDSDAALLQRSCREPGFPVLAKRMGPRSTVYLLRGERLVAIEPATARNELLPAP